MNTSNLRILLLCLLLTGFMGCEGAEKAIPPPELKNKIVYISEQGICTINPDGTDLKVIVPLEKGGRFSNPRWSPDKMWIACTGHAHGYKTIVLVKSDGSELRTLGSLQSSKTTGEKGKSDRLKVEQGEYDISFIAWSPDGKYMLSYPSPCPDCADFLLIDRKGKKVFKLNGLYPAFCGEDMVVYSFASPGTSVIRSDIFCYDLKEKTKKNLTNDGKLIYYSPVPSPDCLRIAYGFGDFTLYNELWMMDSDGSHRRRLVSQNKDFVGGPLRVISFSPDGSKILFLPDNGDKSNLYIINTDGGGLYVLVSGIVNASGGADWSPDGKSIAFSSNKDGKNEPYIVNVDGTGLRRLSTNTAGGCCPDWCSR